MSRLTDPTICPDCRATLDAAATCPACGLRLAGPLAADLWAVMTRADGLVEQLRRQGAPVGVPAPRDAAAAFPAAPAVTAGGRPPRASKPVSAPAVVLTLGALCVLVASIVFVAVAWSAFGLVGKTAILLVVTGLLGAGAALASRRGLRGGAESLWSLVAAMLTLDVVAAHSADLAGLGALSVPRTTALVGLVLLGLGAGVSLWSRGLPLRRVYAAEVAAVVGIVLVALGLAWVAPHAAVATAVAVPVSVGLALLLRRALPVPAYAAGGVAVVSWLLLVGHGLDALDRATSDHAWWTGLHGWPLLVAAMLAAAATAVPTVHLLRVVAATGSLVALIALAAGPRGSETADLTTAALLVLALAAVSAVAPLVWARAAAGLTGIGLLGFLATVLLRPLGAVAQLPTTATPVDQSPSLRVPPVLDGPAWWTALVAAVAVVGAAYGLLRHVPSAQRPAAGRLVAVLAGGLLVLGGATAVLEHEPTILVASLVLLLALTVTAVGAALARRTLLALAGGAVLATYLVVVLLRVGVASHVLAASLASLLVVALAAGYALVERDLHDGWVLPTLAGPAVLLAGFAAMHWPYVAGASLDVRALVVAGTAVVALIAARLVGRTAYARGAVEVGALLVGALALTLPLHATVVAVVATILGSAIALVASLYDDRAWASWLGVAVLGSATVMRVVLEVRAPELFTLPAALLLLLAGVLRMRRDPAVGSLTALGSGLTLALLPSLLLALDEPVSLRGALIGVAGIVVLAAGIVRHWQAPFLAGAVVVGLLALRHLGPVADAIPRWISLGLIGVALLLVGVTWESRRRNLAAAGSFVAALR